jgi:hypothetical protein
MFAVLIPLVLLPLASDPVQPTCGVQPIVETAAEAPVLAGFGRRLEAYMQLHNEVERSLGPRQLFDDPEDLFADLEARRSGIRRARPDAQRGALFTDDVAVLIRTRLEARLAASNHQVEDVLAFINEERLPGTPEPSINKRFPWELGSAMWPSLLAVLPPLPEGLEYRFADRDLVLIDVHASIVVDILVNALPAPRHAGHGAHSR